MNPAMQSVAPWRRPVVIILLLIGLAVVLNWPYLRGGFFGDDIIFLNIMDQDPLPYSRWRGIWGTNAYPLFDHMWWKDFAGIGDSGVFWRPLPSLIIEGSVGLFGRHAFPLHLLSILLHGAIGALLYLFVKRIRGGDLLALLAAIFYIACEDHSMVIGWVATITDPLSVFFIMLSLLAYRRWLEKRRAVYLGGSMLALAAALACKETAAVAPLLLALLALLLPGGKAPEDTASIPWRERLGSFFRDVPVWLAPLLILAAYLAMYKSMGLGGLNNLMYTDPLTNPLGYLAKLIFNMPVMWLATVSVVPPMTLLFWPEGLGLLAGLGLLLFIGWLAALWPQRRNTIAGWALAAYIIALLPQLSADASERGLYFPFLPAAILLAFTVMAIGPLARRFTAAARPSGRWPRIFGWIIAVGVFIPGLLFSALMPFSYVSGFAKPEMQLRTAIPHIEQVRPEHVVILNSSGPMMTLYTWDILNYLTDDPVDAWPLSAANGIFSLERTGDSSFMVRIDRGGWLNNMFARLVRVKPKLTPDRQYRMPIFTATLEQLTRSQRDVLAVRFDMNRRLDDPGILYLYWDGTRFEPIDIAALEIGAPQRLVDNSDLWEAWF